ncbi:hypothetical protein [Photobacterium nomapromontoriensis]|uniref:hypothetical protein n=1 Tax=Photobacterium nomapromontoriensis TaxID=2910237 RepID=UPI003D11D38F
MKRIAISLSCRVESSGNQVRNAYSATDWLGMTVRVGGLFGGGATECRQAYRTV